MTIKMIRIDLSYLEQQLNEQKQCQPHPQVKGQQHRYTRINYSTLQYKKLLNTMQTAQTFPLYGHEEIGKDV